MSTCTATVYKTSAFRRPAFRAPDRGKAQKQRGFRANGTYRACIKDCVLLDPCMGSGHILVYCFDVLMQIYESQGYTQRDAAQSILENNLFGLDIDKRAAQLAYFAIMMKARQYDRRILTREIKPHVYAIEESNGINRAQLKYFGAMLDEFAKNNAVNQVNGLLEQLYDAKEYGSIMFVDKMNWDLLREFAEYIDIPGQMDMDAIGIEKTQERLKKIIDVGEALSQKYWVTCTNPPYMDLTNASNYLREKQISLYQDCGDLYAVFMERCRVFIKRAGYVSLITMQGWMFSSSLLGLRTRIIENNMIRNLIHLGSHAFDNDVGTIVQCAAFVMNGVYCNKYKGTFVDLSREQSSAEKENALFHSDVYIRSQDSFRIIEGCPISYWVSDNIMEAFGKHPPLKDYLYLKAGLSTGNNDLFCRYWYEVNYANIAFDCETTEQTTVMKEKWYPCNSGGEYRKWITCDKLVVNWQNDGSEIRNYRNSKGNIGSAPRNSDYYFKEGMTWNKISSKFTMMYKAPGFVFDDTSRAGFVKDNQELLYYIAFLSSVVANKFLLSINQSFCFTNGDILRLPFLLEKEQIPMVNDLVRRNIFLSHADWDSFESSWNFRVHPLVHQASTIIEAFAKWENECNNRFDQLKANEEELNRIFINIYGLQNELTPEVEDREVTVRKADLQRDIKSLISYAVGCMFGRYSLDEPGLAYAGGEWNLDKYATFIPDKDNCIPITDEEYFEDDIVGLFCAWMKKVYGAENLEANLDFVAKALGNKGTTSREVIRNYFLNDFMKDHIKIYQKRPIYWLFDSGKQNGFKALVYMHRWNADTVGNLRVEYLHKMQHTYEREITRMQETIDNSRDSREVSKATKRKDKLQKQLKETKDYDAKLAHIALSRIEIDLDDGVKVNYEKVQTGRNGKKMQILAKI